LYRWVPWRAFEVVQEEFERTKAALEEAKAADGSSL